MRNSEKSSSEFEEFIKPLSAMSVIVYERNGYSKIAQLKSNYKENLQTNNNAANEIGLIIKNCIKEVIKTLSAEYRAKLKKIYSDDGIVCYIEYIIKQEITNQLGQ